LDVSSSKLSYLDILCKDHMKENLDICYSILTLPDYICKDRMMDEFDFFNNIFYFLVFVNIYHSLDD